LKVDLTTDTALGTVKNYSALYFTAHVITLRNISDEVMRNVRMSHYGET